MAKCRNLIILHNDVKLNYKNSLAETV